MDKRVEEPAEETLPGDSYATVLERLFAAYEGKCALTTISLVTAQARAELHGQITAHPEPELLERLARARLDALDHDTKPRTTIDRIERSPTTRGDDDAGSAGSRRPQLEIHVEDGGPDGHSRIRVVGDLDLATTERLATALAAHLAGGQRAVCLDLAGLTFCDAAGLNTLLAAHHAYRAANSTLRLTGYGRQVAKILRITGLDRVLAVQ